jgi:hypothetical protein
VQVSVVLACEAPTVRFLMLLLSVVLGSLTGLFALASCRQLPNLTVEADETSQA